MWLYIAGGVVLVGLLVIALRGRGGGRDLVAADGTVGRRPAADPPSEARVIELARSNRKIEAIKMLRELRSIGLKEAKDWVDAAAAGRVAAAGTSVPPMRTAGAPRDQEILDVARRGNKIEAIKMARQEYGWGLREAKDWVEAHE